MKLIAFLLLLLTISNTKQSCAAGCLRCDSNNNCVVPDLSKNYVLSNNTAVLSTQTNCAVLNADGSCASCAAGYFLDATTAKCVVVPTASQIASCSYYNTASSCRLCAAGFYLNNNACTAVTTTIANCNSYANATTCYACAAGYVLSLDSTSCVSVSSVQNCSGYSYVSCGSCASGYHLNRNAYLDTGLASLSNASSSSNTNASSSSSSSNTNANASANVTVNNALANYARNILSSTGYSGSSLCQANASTNCSTFTVDSSVCTLCNSGYFLDTTGVCNLFPVEPIANCAIYTNATTCNTCVQGFVLGNNACTAIATANLIANCATYDPTKSYAYCSLCATGYYITAGANNSSGNPTTTCTARSASLNQANCATFTYNADTCATCATGYYAFSTTKCVAVIANCATYDSNTSTATQLQCSVCSNGYVLTAATTNGGQNSCAQGTIANCAIYANATSCTTCADGYNRTNATTCTIQPVITNCTNYDGDSAATPVGVCLTCNAANSFLVTLSNTCQTLTNAVTNCVAYNTAVNPVVCSNCANGFALNSGTNTCATLTITNCLQGTATTTNNVTVQLCTECAAGFVISADSKSCIGAFGFRKDQCLYGSDADPTNQTTIGSYSCSTCNQGAIPILYTGQFACLTLAETAQLNNNTALTASACLKYTSTLSCYQCDPSSTLNTPYLQTDNSGVTSCVATCTSNAFNRIKLGNNNQILQYNVCNTANTIANCGIYAPNINDAALGDICIGCQSGYFPVGSVSTSSYSNVDPSVTTIAANAVTYGYIPAPNAKFIGFTSCVSATGSATINGNAVTGSTNSVSNLTPNCAFFTLISGSNYYCAKCSIGFTGTITTPYITACNTDATCGTNNGIYNLDISINTLASCKSCLSNTNIPMIAYVGTSASNPNFASFAKYDFAYTVASVGGNNANVLRVSGGAQPNTVCRNPATPPTGWNSSYGVQLWGGSGFYNGAGYAGCGLLAINLANEGNNFLDTSANPNVYNYGNFCVACAPGFAPTVTDGTYTYIKKTCTAIANCPTTGNLFNGCSACSSGYILAYNSQVSPMISFTSCLLVPAASTTNLANCYAASADPNNASNALQCGVCKPGYNLNSDYYCEAIQPYNCSAGAFKVNKTNGSVLVDLQWALYSNGNAIGCNRCVSGSVAVNITGNNVRGCATSAYVANTVDTLSSSTYVEHCKIYDATLTATLTCVQCQTNYVLSGDGLTCYASTNLANCLVASSTTVCTTCSTLAYGLLPAGTCVAGAITNCAAYNNTGANNTNATAALCAACNNGYYLNNNACAVGGITNCQTYGASANRCEICATGYFVIDNTNNNNGASSTNIADLCLPIPTALNCADPGIDSSGNYTCSLCTNNTTQVPVAPLTGAAQNACISFSPITNCATYNAGAFASSAFTCATCSSGYYLSNNQCVARTVINKCVTYTPAANTCAACDSTSYLATDQLSCVVNPNGVFKCNTYSNATTCTACKAGYYLTNNTCVLVSPTIANCSTYSNATTCSLCATGYALTNNTCAQATAQNCLTYASPSACASCANTYILSTTTATTGTGSSAVTTSTTSCVAATNKPNCATIDYQSPNNCTSCNVGYYLNNGACTQATNIANCASYASATTCAQCTGSYALSVDKTTCVTNANVTAYEDANCNNNQLVSSPVCSRCGAGKYFVNGACTGSCTQTGCLACGESSNSVCVICNTGYYQDSTGKCNPVSSDAQGGSSASIFGVLSAIVLVFAVMFK